MCSFVTASRRLAEKALFAYSTLSFRLLSRELTGKLPEKCTQYLGFCIKRQSDCPKWSLYRAFQRKLRCARMNGARFVLYKHLGVGFILGHDLAAENPFDVVDLLDGLR